MRNLFKYLLVVISVITLNSCREDGDWGNNNSGVFGFTIDRDTDYIEKALGEANQLKFNIKTDYDFASVPMKFKYTTTLDGVLKLDGKELEANTEYTLTKADNVFEYIGKEAGEHKLKISVKNNKGNSATEEYALKYATQDFKVDVEGKNGEIFQSELTPYFIKITPNKNDENNKYYIKFTSYNGEIRLNGVRAELNTEYPIHNIENIGISLLTNQIGKQRLGYTIRNNSVSRSLEIIQDVIVRKIEILGANISNEAVIPNTKMSIVGTISKTPKNDTQWVKYKTWISSATNNNIAGIETTNNEWQDAYLENNRFKIEFLAKQVGEYTLNFQVQDEYGNESEIKSFNVKVEEDIQFTQEPEMTAQIVWERTALFGNWRYKGTKAFFEVKAGNIKKISKYKVYISFDFDGKKREFAYMKTFDTLQSEVKFNGVFEDNIMLSQNYNAKNPTNLKYVITLYDNNDNEYEKTGTLRYNK